MPPNKLSRRFKGTGEVPKQDAYVFVRRYTIDQSCGSNVINRWFGSGSSTRDDLPTMVVQESRFLVSTVCLIDRSINYQSVWRAVTRDRGNVDFSINRGLASISFGNCEYKLSRYKLLQTGGSNNYFFFFLEENEELLEF